MLAFFKKKNKKNKNLTSKASIFIHEKKIFVFSLVLKVKMAQDLSLEVN